MPRGAPRLDHGCELVGPVEQVVVDREPVIMDDLGRVEHVGDGRAVAEHTADALEYLRRDVVQALVLRGRIRADGVRAVDLPAVTPVVPADLGDEYVARRDDAFALELRGHADRWRAHRRRRHEVDAGRATGPGDRALDHMDQLALAHAGPGLALERGHRDVGHLRGLAQVPDLLFARDRADHAQL